MAEGKATKEAFVQAVLVFKMIIKCLAVQISLLTDILNSDFVIIFFLACSNYAYYQRGLQYLISEELALTNWEESVLKMLKKMQLCHQFYLNTVKAKPEVFSQNTAAAVS
jgi:hypothetical protein